MDKSVMSLLLLVAAMSATVSAKPHIIYLLADDLGWNDVGFHNSFIETPHIDQLATDGVVLNQSYVQQACTPSRHAFMTGRYPFRDGLQQSVLQDTDPNCLPLDLKLLPQRLKDGGYSTHMIGKWHLGYCNEACLPHRRGFDTFFGFLGGETEKLTHTRNDLYDFRDNDDVVEGVTGHYSTYVLLERALDIVHSHDPSDPMFLYMSFGIAHYPLELPPGYNATYDSVTHEARRIYLNMVSIMDDVIGQIIEALKDQGMYDDSLIIFQADNGGAHSFAGNNYPLRGSKATIWEAGTRSPTVVFGSMLEQTGYTNDGLFHITDWYKTLQAAAGIDPEHDDNPRMDSINQWGMLSRGETSQRKDFIYNLDTKLDSPPTFGYLGYRFGDYKLLLRTAGSSSLDMPHDRLRPAEACTVAEVASDPECAYVGQATTGNNQTAIGMVYMRTAILLNQFANNPNYRGNVWLFNIRDDPREMNDLSDARPEIVEMMKTMVQKYIDDEAVPMATSEVDFHLRDRDGSHGPGWCSTTQLLVTRQNALDGATNIEYIPGQEHEEPSGSSSVIGINVLMLLMAALACVAMY